MSAEDKNNNASQIFSGYKALGFVSNHVPAIVRYHAKLDEIRILTSIGKSFNTYGAKLQLVESSHELPDDITCMDSDSNHVFTAAGNKIYAWKNGHRWLSRTYSGHESRVIGLIAFGPHIISVDEDSTLILHEIRSGDVYLTMSFGREIFQITCIMHPSTYTNKMLIGSKQGPLKLINLKNQSTIYEFKGWECAVTVIEQSPAVDIVGIGLSNGRILIHNLRLDETMMDLQQEWGTVRSLAFRTDGPPHLISSGDVGHLAIWDLEKQRVVSQMRDIHSSSIEGAQFILSQPLLITNSSDNSLKVWLFNDHEDTGKQLYVREGHKIPISYIRFYDPRGYHILSSSLDGTLRNFSTLSQRLDRNLGTASFNRQLAKKVGVKRDPNKMPHITMFAAESVKKKEWDDVIAIHNDSPYATSWSSDRNCMGRHRLLPEKFSKQKSIHATSVCISPCGNFTIIGYENGWIEKFNIQSGLHRQSYGNTSDIPGHEGAVTGITTDSLTQILLSAGRDARVKFWTFKKGQVLFELELEAPITKIRDLKESSLVALALNNFRVKVVDMDSRKLARSFPSHESPISDMAFTPDGRWLIVASEDKCIRVWDLLKSRMIDAFLLPLVCRSLDVSPTCEFLATTHDNDVGIFLWTNMTLFSPISLKPLPSSFIPQLLTFPRVKRDTEEDEEGVEEDDSRKEDDDSGTRKDKGTEEDEKMQEDSFISPDQIRRDLITLSLQPSSRWKNLFNIDLIKRRNKPKEPPKVPDSAPFFLPTVAGLQPTFDLSQQSTSQNNSSTQGLDKTGLGSGVSPFGELLLSCGLQKKMSQNKSSEIEHESERQSTTSSSSFSTVLDQLKEMGPSKIDAEIRLLDSPFLFNAPNLSERFSEGHRIETEDGRSAFLSDDEREKDARSKRPNKENRNEVMIASDDDDEGVDVDEERELSQDTPLLLLYFLQAVEEGLRQRRDYELVVSYLALFLRVHSQTLLKDSRLVKQCRILSSLLDQTWNRVEDKFNQSVCIINFLRTFVA